MISADNLPKAYVSNREMYEYGSEDEDGDDGQRDGADGARPRIIRPDVEIEVPDFIALADEIAEAEEQERIRILNKTPVPVLNPR